MGRRRTETLLGTKKRRGEKELPRPKNKGQEIPPRKVLYLRVFIIRKRGGASKEGNRALGKTVEGEPFPRSKESAKMRHFGIRFREREEATSCHEKVPGRFTPAVAIRSIVRAIVRS